VRRLQHVSVKTNIWSLSMNHTAAGVRANDAEALHEPSNKRAAPTELGKCRVCVGGYRHGAPTELLKIVHGHNACARQMESANKKRPNRRRTAALQDLAEGEARNPSRQSRGRGRVRLSSTAFSAPTRTRRSVYGLMPFNPGILVTSVGTSGSKSSYWHFANSQQPIRQSARPLP
jgi:hypothetical protein